MEFNLDDYKKRTARLEWADLDLAAAFAVRPLDPDTLRTLRYMHDVEYHTVCYLRDLLLTPAHNDPEITAFLSFWTFEEFWHGEALADVLAAHGERSGADRVGSMRQTLGWRSKLGPMATAAAGSLLGPDFTAVHMTWGALNEWTTQAGYASVSRRAEHPVLAELLARIMKQEGRHIDFYASQARKRLTASRRARKMTRLALRRLWRPVGSGVMPAEETAFVIDHLFSGHDGLEMARRIDRRVDRLPGLEGLRLVESARGSGQRQQEVTVGVEPCLGQREPALV
jgi:hypothetical protein